MLREFSTSEIFLYLLIASRWTIFLSLIAFMGGGVFGLIIAVFRVVPVRFLNYLSIAYIPGDSQDAMGSLRVPWIGAFSTDAVRHFSTSI